MSGQDEDVALEEILSDGEEFGPASALLRSPIVIIACTALWAMDMYMFRYYRLDYVAIFTGTSKTNKQSDEEESSKEMLIKGQVELVSKVAGRNDSISDESNIDDEVGAQMLPVTPPNCAITSRKLLMLSMFLFALLKFTEYVWTFVMGRRDSIHAMYFFYFSASVFMLCPFTSTQWIRVGLSVIAARVLELIKPRCYFFGLMNMKPVPFLDVFFADIMCSLSKVFFDWGTLSLTLYYPEHLSQSIGSILIPSIAAALPYLIRARQCMIMHTISWYKNDHFKRREHMMNTIKYCTSLFPICLSTYQRTLTEEEAKSLEFDLILLLTVNSLYSFYWDVVMDWGMMHNPSAVLGHVCTHHKTTSDASKKSLSCGHQCLRHNLRYGFFLSLVILLFDFTLRFSWLLRFWESTIFPTIDVYILTTELLEVFRRSIWNLLRVEWENIKTQNARKGNVNDDLAFRVEASPMHTA